MNTWQSIKEWARFTKKRPAKESDRSEYSLVSCSNLTADNLQLWLELPDEIKNDPSLAPFKQMYEKNNGLSKVNMKDSTTDSEISLAENRQEILKLGNLEPNKCATKRLPSVHSAPTITNQKIEIFNGKNDIIEEIQSDDNHEVTPPTRITKDKRISQAKYYVKMTILLACWTFFTAVFMMYGEKEEEEIISSIRNEEDWYLSLPQSERLAIGLSLSGPFLSEHAQVKLNSTQYEITDKIQVWLEGTDLNNTIKKSSPWTLLIDNNTKNIEKLTKVLAIQDSNLFGSIKMNTTSIQTIAFVMKYSTSPIDVTTGVVYGLVLLVALYILIVFEVINRTMAAITVSTMSLSALALVGQRPSLTQIISWLDAETLLLLFCMMILVAIMAETGIFDFLAVFTFEVTKGKLWPLIYLLCAITAILSTFLDNVTTVLLMSPVTIRLCEVMDLDPVPILMFMAIYSNIGGTATPVGDPPNVIVVSNKAVAQSGINFTNFTAHMGLGIIFIVIQTSIQIKFLFRDVNSLRMSVPRDIQELTRQISIWRRAAHSLPHLSKDVDVVRERLERKIEKLTIKLDNLIKESHKRACPKDTFKSTLEDLKGKYKIRDKKLLMKSSIALSFVVIVFFLHSIPELNRVSLGWTALLGAILLLTLADREDLEPILHRVEWSTLLFFAALFVMMEALSELGLILYIGGLMEQLILMVDESGRLAVAIMLILWVSGMISAFVDNIPLTTMMVKVVVAIGSNPSVNLPMSPLVWALLYGACLGGNGTLIAASANVVCAGVAEQHGYKFTFSRFFKVGFPIMIGHLVVASIYLLLCF